MKTDQNHPDALRALAVAAQRVGQFRFPRSGAIRREIER